jgi:transcriptional regulator with XRE-family HTH domain
VVGMSPSEITLDAVLARNLREVLERHEMRHADLAERMRVHGVGWSTNTVAQVLGRHRQVPIIELAALCSVFEVPLTELLSGDDQITVGFHTLPLGAIRQVIDTGRMPRIPEDQRTGVVIYLPSDEEAKAMRRLRIDIGTLTYAADRLFGTTDIVEERDRRAGDLSGLPKRSAQSKRGHAMRSVLDEIAEYINAAPEPPAETEMEPK